MKKTMKCLQKITEEIVQKTQKRKGGTKDYLAKLTEGLLFDKQTFCFCRE